MRRIAQRYFEYGDCGVACVAMISGVSYERAYKEAVALGLRSKHGDFYTRHYQLEELLRKLGRHEFTRIRFTTMREVITPAIVKVNPRESGRYWHWVVVFEDRGGRMVLLDPKPGKASRITSFRGYKGAGYYLHSGS